MNESKNHHIRELEQEKEILEELNKCVEEGHIKDILSKFNHELRTPLVPIKAYVDMLLDGYFGCLEPEQDEKLKEIKKNLDLLIQTISDILEKNKPRN